MRLIICGNGFDAHHGLNTSYDGFKEFLLNRDPVIKSKYEELVHFNGIDNYWNDVEKSLGSVNFSELLSDTIFENYPDMMSDSDSRWYNISTQMECYVSFSKKLTGVMLYQWLSNIDLKQVQVDNVLNDLFIGNNNKFITFNYTNVLEKVYGIDTDDVFHIHGNIVNLSNLSTDEEIRNELKFGNNSNDAKIITSDLIKSHENDEYYNISILPAIHHIEEYCENTYKDIEKNIPKLQQYVSNYIFDEIYIMGHSLNEIDDIYYRDVLIPLYRNKKWIFMNYEKNPKDLITINQFIIKYKIENYIIQSW